MGILQDLKAKSDNTLMNKKTEILDSNTRAQVGHIASIRDKLYPSNLKMLGSARIACLTGKATI